MPHTVIAVIDVLVADVCRLQAVFLSVLHAYFQTRCTSYSLCDLYSHCSIVDQLQPGAAKIYGWQSAPRRGRGRLIAGSTPCPSASSPRPPSLPYRCGDQRLQVSWLVGVPFQPQAGACCGTSGCENTTPEYTGRCANAAFDEPCSASGWLVQHSALSSGDTSERACPKARNAVGHRYRACMAVQTSTPGAGGGQFRVEARLPGRKGGGRDGRAVRPDLRQAPLLRLLRRLPGRHRVYLRCRALSGLHMWRA